MLLRMLPKIKNKILYLSLFCLAVLLYLLNIMVLMLWKNENYLKNIQYCHIPHLDAFDPEIAQFMYPLPELTCSIHPPLVTSNLMFLNVDKNTFDHYNITDLNELNCSYWPFWRAVPEDLQADHQIKYSSYEYPFKERARIAHEFIKVECYLNKNMIYKDFHFFVPLVKDRPFEEPKIKIRTLENNDSALNVIIIGLESVSRLNFHRQMPHTVKVLLKKLKAIEYFGYNALDYVKFPNLLALLTGHNQEEIESLCWAGPLKRFDSCPFIWKDFKENGYLTSFAEETSNLGAFNFLKLGFKEKPTDYYWQVGSYVAEKEIGHKTKDLQLIQHVESLLCMGPRPIYVALLEYAKKMFKSLKYHRYFSIFWETSLTHEHLNYPSMGDETYAKFFQNMIVEDVLNNSIMFVVSDHGMLWDNVLLTYQGYLEARLPLLFIVLPPWFEEKYKLAGKNLRKNAKRLTSPYDLHETMNHILNPDDLTDESITKHMNDLTKGRISSHTKRRSKLRNLSLFHTIPENRTCESAGIPANYCICHPVFRLDTNNITVQEIAEYIISKTNIELLNFPQCAELSMDRIVDAKMIKGVVDDEEFIRDYTIIVKVQPAGFILEGNVRVIIGEGGTFDKYSFRMMSTIRVRNKVKMFDACVSKTVVEPFCYCI